MGVFTTTKSYRLGLNLTNQWWLSGASIDLDFDNQRYYDSSLGAGVQSLAPLNSYLSISRASAGYAQNLAGSWVAFGNDTLRITDKGLLVEDARTNYLLNSTAPATQTTASLSTGSYTLWVEGSGSATPSAGTATITGAGPATAGAPDTFTVTVAGTVTVTVSGSLTRFQLEAGTFASSPIDTAGATATRATDLISFAGSAKTLLEADSDQSIVADVLNNNPSLISNNNQNIICDNGAANDAKLMFGTSGAAKNISFNYHTVTSGFVALGSGDFYSPFKCGFSQNAGSGISIVGNGGTVATNANRMPLTNPRLGAKTDSDSFYGYIRRLTLWNTKLADATLQSLTVP